jgi:exoribonuclease-2
MVIIYPSEPPEKVMPMSEPTYPIDSLVIYKKRPARVIKSSERLEIEIEGGNIVKVRPKDIELLHPGPLRSLKELTGDPNPPGDVELAWQILGESNAPLPLPELADLIYGSYNPASAWAAWAQVDDGVYFQKSADGVLARSAAEVSRETSQRQSRQREAQSWQDFLERLRQGKLDPTSDARYLRETEDLALGRRKDSRLLKELGRSERPETAHALLLEWGYWDAAKNPYPSRLGISLAQPLLTTPDLPGETRLDLTALPAFAIDDRENKDPDDALSLIDCQLDANGHLLSGRLWVHVADVAALAPPDSPLDLEARQHGATFYLPEGPVTMLPQSAIQQLGLGLQEISPALSFELELDADANPRLLQVQPSLVRVQRLSYEQAELQLETEPFRSLNSLAQAYQARRQAHSALNIDLPEAIFKVQQGKITIQPIQRLRSRDMVREAMLMAGEATARFAVEQRIPFPFAAQEPPDLPAHLQESLRQPEALQHLSTGFAVRRYLKRSQITSLPAPHAGLGLPMYSRTTSPLRRYLDLLVHQQLRLYLSGKYPLGEQALLERLGSAESVSALIAQAEGLSRRHWTLVYLQERPGWQAEGVLVEKNGLRGIAIIPELALEVHLHLRADLPLDASLPLKLQVINLPDLEAHFTIA